MRNAIFVGALVTVLGCGGGASQGASGQTPAGHEHGGAHDGCGCPHCKGKGGEGCAHCEGKSGSYEHCQNKGMKQGGHEGMHHGGHGGMHQHVGGHEGHGGPLVHRFEKAEDWAKEFDDPARDAWQKPAEVVAAMGIAPGMIVADVGAGTGYFMPHLSKAVGPTGKVLAIDIEPDMVRYLHERATKEKLVNVTAQQATTDGPGLAAGSVDRILIVDTWHHIPERTAYAQKLRAALRPGGLVIIVDFTLEATKGPPKEHRISAEKVISELDAGGLSGKAIDESLPEQYIVVAKAK